MANFSSGDGSNAPVTQVKDILAEHFTGGNPVETPQEEEDETLEASEQDPVQDPTQQESESLEAEEAGEEEQEPVAASDDAEIETLADFAEALEIDPSDLYGLTYAMPDGMEPVTLSEMKDAYIKSQREGAPSESEAAQALQAERQQFEMERQQAYEQMQMQMQVPPQLQQIDANLNNVMQARQNTDWKALEKLDPGDAALQRQKLAEAENTLLSQRQQLMGQMQHQQAQQMQQAQQAQQQHAQEQLAAVLNKHPEWKDNPKAIETAWGDVIEFAGKFGVPAEQMKELPDGNIFNMLYQAASMLKTPSKKLTRKSAPALRAGRVRALKGKKSTKLESLIKRGTDSSDIRDKTAAVSALLNS